MKVKHVSITTWVNPGLSITVYTQRVLIHRVLVHLASFLSKQKSLLSNFSLSLEVDFVFPLSQEEEEEQQQPPPNISADTDPIWMKL